MGVFRNTRTVTDPSYTIQSYDEIIYADTSLNAIGFTLPHITTGNIIPGHKIKFIDSASNWDVNKINLICASGDGSTIIGGTNIGIDIKDIVVEVELLENNVWEVKQREKVLRDKIVFVHSGQTNSLAATYNLDLSSNSVIQFTADSNVTLGYTGAEQGTYTILVDTAGFTVDLAVSSGWFSVSGLQPTFSGVTLLSAYFDGVDMYVTEMSDLQEIT